MYNANCEEDFMYMEVRKTVLAKLDDKYTFNWLKISEKAGVSTGTVNNFERGKNVNVSTAAKIINALPITPKERQELINSYFEPKE